MPRPLSRLWRGSDPFPAIAPDIPFTAIGDVHGCAALLGQALDRIEGRKIICVGDYVDRGPDSAGTLRLLQASPDIICLSGNHEEMMLAFIAAPEGHARDWLRHGGIDTLASFGITGVDRKSDPSNLAAARDALVEAMGPDLLAWLQALPRIWRTGNVAVLHAAADPALPLDRQDPATFHWGHPRFVDRRRKDGQWIVHGHTVVDQATTSPGRIAIDTGAYATGCLTLAHVDPGEVRFETVTLR